MELCSLSLSYPCSLTAHDFGHGRATRFALERALIMVCLVGLNPSEPHRHCARRTFGVFGCLRAWNVVRLLHNDPHLAVAGGRCWLSPVGPWPVMFLMSDTEQKSPVSKDIPLRSLAVSLGTGTISFRRMNVVAGFALEKVDF